MIKLNSLQKFFNKGKQNEIHVINDVTLEFPDHGMVALFGRSGCGKTTLLNVIGGLDSVQGGTIEFDGESMSANADVLRNRYIGYIFQNYYLNVRESCYDNVADSLRLCGMEDAEEIDRRVMAALEAVGMKQYYKRMPDALSGGQQQRIAIARAIVKNPPIILADEPTGNLDENNTVMIMDILKQFSKEHLVLLVTHEEKLVDHYCDTVIQLSDGKVSDIRNNSSANGYNAKNKNTIYLGEYDKSSVDSEQLSVSYYGEKPEKPIDLKLINRNGVFYLKVETPGIHVLDETSEIILEEGVFAEETRAEESASNIDLSALGPFEGKNYGNLFDFKQSVRDGYYQVFSKLKNKKSTKRLRKVMFLFAAATVFMVAIMGVSIKKFADLHDTYNFKAISVGVPQPGGAEILTNAANDPASKIDSIVYSSFHYDGGRESFDVMFGSFETYSRKSIIRLNEDYGFRSNIRPYSDIKNPKLLAGTTKTESIYDIVITRNIADQILKKSPYKFVNNYNSLVGFLCYSSFAQNYIDGIIDKKWNELQRQILEEGIVDEEAIYEREREFWESPDSQRQTKYLRIIGIIDSDELAVFANDELFVGSYSLGGEENHFSQALVYSSDVEATKNYLREHTGLSFVVIAEYAYDDTLSEAKLVLKSKISAMVIFSLILAVCMYFIMRTIYMNRVKELGIYRAIGVSKKNLLYRASIECGVLTTLTVMLGYLVTTIVVTYIQSVMSLASNVFYYPWWLKLITLVFLYVICIFSGTLSARLILRKTPAEIMAKYDI